MSKLNAIGGRFLREEKGAALIEYSLLIGIITAATVGIIILVGPKLVVYWTNLNNALP